MAIDVTRPLKDVLLTEDDIDEIFMLYELSRTTSTYGFLAIRTRDDYRVLFQNPETVVATGVRDDGRLIAYSMCHRLTHNPYPENRIIGAIDASVERIYHGDGTTVHPDYQGRMLAKRMFKLRQREIESQRIEHMVGLIAVDNLISLGNVMHSGAFLVDFARDETATNFVVYGGRLNAKLRIDLAPTEVDWKNHEKQKSLFDRGHAVCGLSRARQTGAQGGNRTFSFRPMR